MARASFYKITILAFSTLAAGHAVAASTTYGGVEFPGGDISFADSVVSYDPNFSDGSVPSEPNSDADNALGAPQVAGSTNVGACQTVGVCDFVSLGAGGQLILEFTDNFLTGSNDSSADLWIFEVGADVEDTVVDISINGDDWLNVGQVGGSTSGIDIDAFGYDATWLFSFVRLTDVLNEGQTAGISVGADIDAVGAITTVPVSEVPLPAAAWLFLSAIGGAGLMRKRLGRSS
ncbi:MAG: VPLPA-CTERM sorting domain-containing protein [Halieaceae bacterium]|jgi:hypothetical protein|nr:VPLPA-CTERM sorting domain-containing protein [Halieaceae bacterium]